MSQKKAWLVKSEPSTYSIDDLMRDKRTWWEGVRNYQARNFMKEMAPGDLVLFYHSSCEIPAVVGIAIVKTAAAPDKSALDRKSEYFDPKSSEEKPIWYNVELQYSKKFKAHVPLERLRNENSLKDMILLKKGSRLSVQPVHPKEYQTILNISESSS